VSLRQAQTWDEAGGLLSLPPVKSTQALQGNHGPPADSLCSDLIFAICLSSCTRGGFLELPLVLQLKGKGCHRRNSEFVSQLGRSATPGGGKSPGRWSVLVSAVVQGKGARSGLGGCAAWQPAPRLAGDHEMSLQVQPKPKPENPLNL